MNLSAIDLNLFVVLDVVLAERSATRAAARLHVTQSAVSNALRRLRELLHDPLVVRTRRGLTPTPRALVLRRALEEGLESLRSVIAAPPEFDPSQTRQELRIACIDLHAAVLLPKLLPLLRERAPHASLVVRSIDQVFPRDGLASGDLDLYIGDPRTLPAGWHWQLLLEDEMVAVLRKEHRAARRPLTLEALAALPLVQAKVRSGRGDELDEAMAKCGMRGRTVLTVPHFSIVPAVVRSSDCLGVLPRRLAEAFAPAFGLRIRALPVALPRSRISMHWHRRVDGDPAVAFLRGLLEESARVA